MALTTKPLSEVRPDVPTQAAAKGELVRINFLVPPDVRLAWKKLALDRGQTMQDFIIEAVSKNFNTSKL